MALPKSQMRCVGDSMRDFYDGSDIDQKVAGRYSHDEDMEKGLEGMRDGEEQQFAPPPYVAARGEHTNGTQLEDHRIDIKISSTMIPSITSSSASALHIVIQIVGLRDDLSSFLAIGLVLKSYGHRVRIATHAVFQHLVKSYNLEFFDVGGDPETLMEQMLQCSGVFPSAGDVLTGRLQALQRDMRIVMNGCWRSCFENSSLEPNREPFVADLIIANPVSHAHIHCAQKLGIPAHIVSTAPSSSIQTLSHPITNVKPDLSSNIPNYAAFELFDVVIWQVLGSTVNAFRRETLDLDAMDSIWTPGTISRLKFSHTLCWSPSVLPKPEDCPHNIEIFGYCFLPETSTNYIPPPDITNFLTNEETPVYINFGPVVLTNFDVLENLIFEAVRLAEVRAVVYLGSKTLRGSAYNSPNERVLLLNDAPGDWIIPQVSCVVHSGSSDITAQALRNGRPCITVLFFGDQAFWGDTLATLGVGPKPIPFGQLTSENLAQAITTALQPGCSDRAKVIAERIDSEEGAENAANNIVNQFPIASINCSISENRTAVWRCKKNPSMRLSPLAAAVLEDEGLLTIADLSLDRPIKHNLDAGPWDPLSGGTSAIAGLFLDTFHGIGEIGYDIANVFGTVHRLSNNLADGPRSGTDRFQKPVIDNSSTKTAIPGVRALKGTGRIAKAAARAPMTFTCALAQGSHNLPLLWGDKLVRPQPEITGAWSGLTAGVKELLIGTYDGVAGLIEHPIVGAQTEGVKGFAKGVCHGVLGLPTRWFAAASGIVGYPLKGVDRQIVRMVRCDPLDEVVKARIEQGRIQAQGVSLVERYAIVNKWKAGLAEQEMMKKKAKKGSKK